MSDFNIRINNVDELQANSFHSDRTGGVKSGTIKIGGREYAVSFKNDRIDVSRKGFSLFALFQKNYSSEIKAKLTMLLHPKDFIRKNNFSDIKSHIKPFHNKTREVAMYGMTKPRAEAFDTINKINQGNAQFNNNKDIYKGTMIDTYNALLGINPESLDQKFMGIVKSIKNGSIGKGVKVEVNEAYDSKTAKDWKAFLSKNADRVDIFKKVDRYITEGFVDGGKHKKTGWAHEVRKFGQDKMISSFISKQLKPDERECISKDDMKSMVETFKECMKENNKGKLDDNKLNSIIQKHLGSSEDNVVFFKKALTTAFFRQTSKLGLEFFRSKKIPVVFQWSDFNGKSLDNAEGKKEINDKWWLNGYKKSSAGKYGSITYSEMRHVERMNQTKNKIDVVKVGGHNINNDIFA